MEMGQEGGREGRGYITFSFLSLSILVLFAPDM